MSTTDHNVPLMEFWPDSDGDLKIHYPQERTLEGGEVYVWLSQADAQWVIRVIQSRQKPTKGSLILHPVEFTMFHGRTIGDIGESDTEIRAS